MKKLKFVQFVSLDDHQMKRMKLIIREIRAIRWQDKKNVGGNSIHSIHSMITEDNIKQ